MRTRREKSALLSSIMVTVLAYGILGFVLFRERPATIYSEGVARLPHAIAFVNALALVLLAVGWWLIRKGYVGLHRIAMPSALGLIPGIIQAIGLWEAHIVLPGTIIERPKNGLAD